MVHLLGRQRYGRRVLDEHALSVPLKQRLAAHRVLLIVLQLDRTGVIRLARAHIIERGALDCVPLKSLGVMRHVGRAAHAHAGRRSLFAVFEVVRQLHDGMLAHAEHHAVRTRRFQNGRHDAVRPVIVVRKATQTRLDAAEINRRVRERAASEHGIDGNGAVGTLAAFTARRIRIVRAALFRRGVVRDHRIDVAAVDEHRVARTAHRQEITLVVEIRLTENGDLVARILQHARDNGCAERGVVYVGVARHEQEIAIVPSAFGHILLGNRKKSVHFFSFAAIPPRNRTFSVNHKKITAPEKVCGYFF